ncbi:MAG: class I SAM-dependent methyltransferase [Candidatus Nanopelagicales bacterium]|nr:class I SAM-dependent methyltransferase [Candidatus Nanopelagicales bacterium]
MTWLTEAGPQISRAGEILERTGNPLTAASAFRKAHPELSGERAAQVLDQAQLRALARDRHGRPDADDLLLTRDGLEQGTRGDVAAWRADTIRSSGARRVLDLTAGLGFDARAFAQAGLEVTAIERDSATAELLAWNLRHWPHARVLTDDATSSESQACVDSLDPHDVVFVDPARRDPVGPRDLATGRARPERDPERWSPPLSFITGLRHSRVVVKAAPAFQPPAGWHAEWISHDRTVVECSAWSWPAFEPARRAVIMSRTPMVVEPQPGTSPIQAVAAYMHEPDPVLVRAGLLPHLGVNRIDDASTWLTSEDPAPAWLSPALRTFRVVRVLDGSLAEQRATLREFGITRLVIKSRDVDVDPRQELSRLGVSEGGAHVLVMTRQNGRSVSVLTTPES